MPDLGKSNTEWDAFFDRLIGGVLTLARWTVENRDRVAERRTQVRVVDPRANTDPAGGVVVAGAKLGNTGAGFKLFARVTGAGDPRTVSWYKATGAGGGDLVAQGSGNAGTTVAMAEQNGSGISGSHPLNSAITADADDRHVLELEQDWRPFEEGIFDGTDPEGEDAKSLQAIADTLDVLEDLHDQAVAAVAGLLAKLLVADAANKNPRPYGSKFLSQAFTSLLTDAPVSDGSGAITRSRSGALEVLRQAMLDETTGSTQTIKARVVQAAAAVASSANIGLMTIGTHTPEGQMPTGRVTLEVVAGLGSGDGGRETLRLSWASDQDDRTKTYSRLMQIGQSYKGEDGFGGAQGITPQRVLTKDGDGSDHNLNDLSTGWGVSGESEQNTDAGDLTWKVVEDSPGTTWIYEFYKSDNLVTGELVARSPAVAAGATFVATQRNTSGLQITGVAGDAPVDGTTGTLHLNFLRVTNDSGFPDKWTIDVTLDSEGTLSRLLARLPILGGNGYRLNGVDDGSERVPDSLVKSNTFPDFSVEDN